MRQRRRERSAIASIPHPGRVVVAGRRQTHPIRAENDPAHSAVVPQDTGEAARWVREKQWHPSQRLRPCKDGRLEVSFRLTHLAEVRRWVLSYGAACEVLEPSELRQQVVEELRRMLGEYEK
jgi:predicted DNA-binding transcriptional regulator YafY